MPRMDGVQATRVIRKEVLVAEVVLISQSDPSVGRRQAIETDAEAFVAKCDLSGDALSTIDKVVSDRDLEIVSDRNGRERDRAAQACLTVSPSSRIIVQNTMEAV